MEHPTRIGKYNIEQYLGGGMSHVYRATDSVLGRRVAVKVLTEAATKETESKARFLQEARLASNISHDNIIAVYDFGEENGMPFMVMEFLEGESLRQALDHGTAGDLRRKLEIAVALGRALDHIHSKQIVHRDIKPENINVDANGRVKLMDFGIAKAQNLKLTRAGFTLGTPYYMAPEQVMGQEVTPQTDVYSFGVLLYEMLAGAKPFQGEGYEKIFQQTLHEQPSQEPLKAANVPQPVIQLVMRLLAKQPAQRPAGFGVVCGEIEGIVARLVPVKTPVKGSAKTPAKSATQSPIPRAPATPGATDVLKHSTNPKFSTPEPPAPATPTSSGSFTDHLPPPLRSPVTLMLLSAIAVLALVAIVFMIASRFV